MAELPSGTLTFLFSDIEGSTRLLRQLRDRYAQVLGDHRTLMRAAFSQFGGEEMGTEGDAFFLAFRRARDALGAAAAAQRALAAHEWPDGAELRVRMGLNTGEPGVEEEGYFGLGLHLTARICSAASGGQVLVSQSTCAVAQEEELEGMELRDLGEHRLKDFERPQRLFQLVVDGLPSDFPPPRTLDKQAAGDTAFRGDVGLPYKGLEAFQPQDAEFFFGREELVADLATRLARSAFLAVVGPSGSGKSSAVRAGLVPAIWTGAHGLETGRSWKVVLMTPGAHPLEELAVRLAAERGLSPGAVLEDLRRDPHNLCLAVRQLLLDQPSDAKVVLIVDQAEEAFTLCRDEEERRLFLETLAHAAAEISQTVVVLALRADFYGHCASYPELAALVQDHQSLVGPMREAEIRRAIERPAAKAGLQLEPGLVSRILEDAGNEPGSLPLLSHALLETWSRRENDTMTLAAYLDSGGVRGAIARTADAVYGTLEPAQQEVARTVFLRLTEPGQGTEDTRRRASLGELLGAGTERAAVEDVLDILARARLITVGLDSVEVAHEALIREWPLLRRWLDQDREGLLVHRRLTDDAGEWTRYERDSGLLYRGARLSAAQEWAEANDARLSADERAFLDASRTEREREAEVRRRRQLALKATAVALAVLLALAAAAALVALDQRGHAQSEERSARARALVQATEAQRPQRLDLALLLGAEAERTHATTEGRSALLAAVQDAGRIRHFLRGATGPVEDVAFSSDGTRVASVGDDGRVRLWDAASGRPAGAPFAPAGPAAPGNAIAFGAGSRVAVGEADGIVRLWDARSRRQVAVLRAPGVGDLAFSADGSRLAAATEDGAVVWDVGGSGSRGRVFSVGGRPALHVSLSADGGTIAAAGIDTVTLWNVRTRAARPLPGRAAVDAIDLAPNGKRLAVALANGAVEVWDVSARPRARRLAGLSGATAVAFSPDGGRLAVAAPGGTIALVDVASGRALPVPLRGHTDTVNALSFARRGDVLASASDDGTAIVWDARRDPRTVELAHEPSPVVSVAASDDGRTLGASSADGALVWRLPGERPIRRIRRSDLLKLDVSGDGTTLAAGTQGGDVLLARLPDGPERTITGATASEPVLGVALSKDGKALAAAVRNGAVHLGRTDVIGPDLENRAPEVSSALALAFSPDGRTLAAGREGGMVTLWDVEGRSVLGRPFRAQTGDVVGIAFAPDGKTFATAGGDPAAYVWDAQTRRRSGEPFGGGGRLGSVRFSPDGSLLAAGTTTGGVVLFDAKTRAPLGEPLSGHAGNVFSVAFAAGGRSLVSAGADGRVLLWNVEGWADEDALRARACQLAGRNLTRSEWSRFVPGKSYRRTCDAFPPGS